MKRCWIFDIDGTLANGKHREHHIVRTDEQPKDWDRYFAAIEDDEPIQHMRFLILSLVKGTLANGFSIIYVSGRPEEYRKATEQWLTDLGYPWPENLYMRPAGDRRDDDVVKIELLAKLRADGYEPLMAFDDRTRVVKAWRAAGVPCAQVAEGDF